MNPKQDQNQRAGKGANATGLPSPGKPHRDFRHYLKLGIGGASLAVGILLPGTMPFTIAGLYILTKESPAMQRLLTRGREKFPGFFNATFKVSRWAETWFKGTGVYKWATRKLGREMPAVTDEIDALTRPTPAFNGAGKPSADPSTQAARPAPRSARSPSAAMPATPKAEAWTRALTAEPAATAPPPPAAPSRQPPPSPTCVT